jgi:flagellar FliJ protein
MTVPFSQRLQRITDLAEHRTDAAANAMAVQLRGLAAAQDQLAQLQQFRHEYAELSAGAASRSVPVAVLRNRQQFVAKIDAAIGQQSVTVQAFQQRVAGSREDWLGHRQRSKALDSVTRQQRDRETSAASHAEQLALDDRSQHPKKPW